MCNLFLIRDSYKVLFLLKTIYFLKILKIIIIIKLE